MARLNPLMSSLLALALLGAAGPAAAGEPAVTRASVSVAVGHWIAAQGNAALREIRDDLRKHLVENLKPQLPAPTAAPSTPTKR